MGNGEKFQKKRALKKDGTEVPVCYLHDPEAEKAYIAEKVEQEKHANESGDKTVTIR